MLFLGYIKRTWQPLVLLLPFLPVVVYPSVGVCDHVYTKFLVGTLPCLYFHAFYYFCML